LVKTKSVYHDPIDQDDGVRILVMRWWPRGVSKEKNKIDMWARELGPSNELLQDLRGKKVDIPEYEKRYFKEMESQTNKIRELTELARNGNITFLCWEKIDEGCHRKLLKQLIENNLGEKNVR